MLCQPPNLDMRLGPQQEERWVRGGPSGLQNEEKGAGSRHNSRACSPPLSAPRPPAAQSLCLQGSWERRKDAGQRPRQKSQASDPRGLSYHTHPHLQVGNLKGLSGAPQLQRGWGAGPAQGSRGASCPHHAAGRCQ